MASKTLKSIAAALVPVAFIVACRLYRPLADFYSLRMYPAISAALSWISSPWSFSFQGVAIVALVVLAVVIGVRAVRRKKGFLAGELALVLWVFSWFYLGWCLNYSRSSIFERTSTQRAPYDSTVFLTFLDGFSAGLDSSYVADCTVPDDVLENEIKSFYASVPSICGLCSPKPWQHPKRMMPERLHSATGVLGYMGPLFSEFHVNGELLPMQVPFTWAHEYSHLLGVSSEAEANWWAWNACTSSGVPALRYSAYFSMLPYVMGNASRLLPEDEYRSWISTLRPEVIEELRYKNQYWAEKRVPALDAAQSWIYDLFLKGNSIPSGTKNYSEVVQMMMAIDYDKIQLK